jgi:hypothetical protein
MELIADNNVLTKIYRKPFIFEYAKNAKNNKVFTKSEKNEILKNLDIH